MFDQAGAALGYMPVYDTIVFDPVETTASTLYGWFKADSFALADGDQPYWWNDSSTTTTNHLTAPTATIFPTYKTSIVNGNPVLRFAGAANEYLFHQTTPVVAQPWSVVAVAKATDITGSRVIAGTSDASGRGAHADRRHHRLSSHACSDPAQRIGSEIGSIPCVRWHLQRGIVRSCGLTACARSTPTPAPTWLTGLKVGANYTGTSRFVGDIAEVIFYGGALATGDRDDLETYLGAKYGISVT